jgi:tetratricopeptide (TPR) repeat protein
MASSGWKDMIGAALGALLVVAVPTQAQPQSGLSEKLSKSITGARRFDGMRMRDEAARVFEDMLGDESTATPAKRRIALKARAWVYEQAREYDRAEADYSAALALVPADTTDYVDRGYFRLRQRRYADAIADFTAGGRLDPGNPRFRYAVGRVYAAMRNYPAAIEQYDLAIRVAPRDAVTFLSRAEANVHLKNYADAQSDYDRAVRIGLRRPGERLFAHLGRGYLQLVKEDFEAAVADFDLALEVEPYAVNLWMWRGYANERLGRIEAAIADYERANNVDPGNGVVIASLRRVRSRDAGPAPEPSFQIDDNTRLFAESQPGLVPRLRPQM